MMTAQTIKSRLLEKLNGHLDLRITEIEKSLQSVKDSRDSDTKSSAGDKYETGREIIQQEMDKQTAQLLKAKALKNDLQRIHPTKEHEQAEFGSIVVCDQGNYFLSVPIGRIELNGVDFFCLSLASPMGQALVGRKIGEQVLFSGKRIVVEEIY